MIDNTNHTYPLLSQESREKSEALRDSTLQQQLQQEEAHKRWTREMEEKHAQEIEKVGWFVVILLLVCLSVLMCD